MNWCFLLSTTLLLSCLSVCCRIFTMVQINVRYSSSMVVDLPQPIANLSLIPFDCQIFGYCWHKLIVIFFDSIAHGLFSFFKLTRFTSSFWLIDADLQLNLERWQKWWYGVGSIPSWFDICRKQQQQKLN